MNISQQTNVIKKTISEIAAICAESASNDGSEKDALFENLRVTQDLGRILYSIRRMRIKLVGANNGR